MINELYKAIIDKFKAYNALYSALSGKLYLLDAPEGTSMPYGVFFPVWFEHDATMSTNIESALIQFNLFGDIKAGQSAIGNIAKALYECYDDCVLSLTGYSFMQMTRRRTFFQKVDDAWQYSIEYICQACKNK